LDQSRSIEKDRGTEATTGRGKSDAA